MLAYLVPPLICIYFSPNFFEKIEVKNHLLKQGGGVFIAILISLFYFTDVYKYNLAYTYYQNINEYHEQIAVFHKEMHKRQAQKESFKNLKTNNPTDENQTYVLVIGESTTRVHMGLYDYYRQTNPLLTNKKDKLYVFNDVVSPHSHTLPTLEKVLTFANHEDMEARYKNGTLMELMKQAGFKTYWISNQHFVGEWDESVTSTIAKQADWYLFMNDPKIKADISYDECLLKPLKVILKSKPKKKFIVLHLLGTHGSYEHRYPNDSKFNKYIKIEDVDDSNKPFITNWGRMMVNEYDNAVLYNDYIISELVDILEEKNDNAYMLYFSDHGEEVYDLVPMNSHQESNATTTMFEIPFILWTSNKYKAHNPIKIKEVEKSLDKKYQTDDVIHTLIDLTNLSLTKAEYTRSIINPAFKPKNSLSAPYFWKVNIYTFK